MGEGCEALTGRDQNLHRFKRDPSGSMLDLIPGLHASFLGTSKKVGRNDSCPCGSGKKYKKCCLAKH